MREFCRDLAAFEDAHLVPRRHLDLFAEEVDTVADKTVSTSTQGDFDKILERARVCKFIHLLLDRF